LKSKSDKSEDTKSNDTVAALATTLQTDAPVDPLLASLFEKSVSLIPKWKILFN
jgi:nucleolar protein 12